MTLEQQVAALAARVAALEAAQKPAAVPEPPRFPGPPRDGQGRVIPDPVEGTDDAYRERMRRQGEAERASDDAFWAKATEGMPDGAWRDPTGIPRSRDGRHLARVDREAARAAEVNAMKARAPKADAF